MQGGIQNGIVSHLVKIIRCSNCFAYSYNSQQMVMARCQGIGVTLQSPKCITAYKDGCHRLQHPTHMNSVMYSVTIILITLLDSVTNTAYSIYSLKSTVLCKESTQCILAWHYQALYPMRCYSVFLVFDSHALPDLVCFVQLTHSCFVTAILPNVFFFFASFSI